jgi:hypothetical protein
MYWPRKCENLDPTTKIGELWQLVRAMSGKFASKQTIRLKKHDGHTSKTDGESAEILARFFSEGVTR